MKHFILPVCLLFFVAVTAQQSGQMLAYSTNGTMVDPDWKVHVVAADGWKGGNEVSGTIFYNDEMNNGYIVLQNGKITRDVLLRYNAYNHEINFMNGKTEMVLDAATPVHEFGYGFTTGNDQKTIVFRSGYPVAGNNNAATFYEVVVDRDLALLRYVSKSIIEKTDDRGASEKVVVDADQWFVYNAADKSMVEIKKNKNALMSALPQYAERIQKITTEKRLRLKSDADWYILLSELSGK